MLRIAALTVLMGSLLVYVPAAWALPFIDLEVSAQYWPANAEGEVAKDGDDIDLQDNMGFDREGTPVVHLRASLPMITLDGHYTPLEYTGETKDIAANTRFGEVRVRDGQSTRSEIDLLHGGVLLSPPFPLFDFGIGLGATRIDGKARIGSETGGGEVTLPVAKGFLRFEPTPLPLSFEVRANGLAYQGDRLTDVTAEIGYEVVEVPNLVGLQVRGGYRRIGIDVKQNDFKVDTTFKGPFAGVTLSF